MIIQFNIRRKHNSRNKIKITIVKNLNLALAWWLSWSEYHPVCQKMVGGLIPGQGPHMGGK